MIQPKECKKCQKGFCRKCINDYIQQLVIGKYDITCPNCGVKNFKPSNPHPLVLQTLTNLNVKCMNAEIGCKVKISYNEMTKHMTEC